MSAYDHEVSVREVGDGVHAYLQRGGWGYSNAGLITDSGESLLVDTLYDVALTQRMLAEFSRHARPGAIRTVVNTHANGDHFWGNQAVSGARIVSSLATAREMRALPPKLMALLVGAARAVAGGTRARRVLSLLGRLGVPPAGAVEDAADFIVEAFGAFQFGDVSLRLPTDTFSGQLELHVGSKTVQLIEVGPAHTRGDTLVYLPAERVVFTGDILFIGSHPVIWEGPVENWIRACDRLLALDVDVIVPGHGPITDKAGVQRTKDYWLGLVERCTAGRAAGESPMDIARDLYRRGYEGWSESSRVAVNVETICRGLSGNRGHASPLSLLARMGHLERSDAAGPGARAEGRAP